MRTRIIPKMLNTEVEQYLMRNDIVIVPVGTVEMHGGLPLDTETVASEGIALKMAEKVDGLVLTGLPYFYAGATASGRGTVQVSVRQGIDYLSAIAKSLLRQGFKRQIYLSLHGPAVLTCGPMVRDFFDETGVPILYIDIIKEMGKLGASIVQAAGIQPTAHVFNDILDSICIGAYDIMGRLEDVPLVTQFATYGTPSSTSGFGILTDKGFSSSAIGFYCGEHTDHMPTTALETAEQRTAMAQTGRKVIDFIIEDLNMPQIVAKLSEMKTFNDGLKEKYPWVPSNCNES